MADVILSSNESRTVEFVWLCTGAFCSEIYLYDAGRCVECNHALHKRPAWRRTHETCDQRGPYCPETNAACERMCQSICNRRASKWQPLETAPKGVLVEGLNTDGEVDRVEYRETRQCMLSTVARGAGECGAGWVSKEAGNLPVDPPTAWRPIQPPAQKADERPKCSGIMGCHVHWSGWPTHHPNCSDHPNNRSVSEGECHIRPHDLCSAGTCKVCVDAARYRWLQDNGVLVLDETLTGDALDIAVDAERRHALQIANSVDCTQCPHPDACEASGGCPKIEGGDGG